jgi:hypothetical protein
LTQKVLTDFQAPLELFSLEEEATLLPGGLFVFGFSSTRMARNREADEWWGGDAELLRIFCVSSVVRIL